MGRYFKIEVKNEKYMDPIYKSLITLFTEKKAPSFMERRF